MVRAPELLVTREGDGVGGDAAAVAGGVERFWRRESTAERTGSVSTVSAERPSGRELIEGENNVDWEWEVAIASISSRWWSGYYL